MTILNKKSWKQKKSRVNCIGLLVVCFLMLLIVGCKTVKQTSTSKAEVKTAANLDVKQSSDAGLNINNTSDTKQSQSGTVKATDTGTVEETIDETNTTTNFSKPDSTGNQYPISTNTNKKTTHKVSQKNLNTNVDNKSNIDYLTRNEDKSNFKFDESITDKNKSDVSLKTSDQLTQETKAPGWVYVVGFGLLLVVGLFLYIKFK